MKKYYVIDVFLVERLEKSKYHDCIHEREATKLIVTRTFGGFKEIKTGRFIPELPRATSVVQYNYYIWPNQFRLRLPMTLKRDVLTNGAILIAIPECINFLRNASYHYNIIHKTIRPVQDIEEVREYLNGNTAEELFEKLDNIRKEGLLSYKAEKKNSRKEFIEKNLKDLSEKIKANSEKKQKEKKIASEIKEEMKKRK